ncbi:MAG: rSAM/selenodomain-associated transferase 1 [Pseudohongiellaceae bacterium]|jgi:rSAM/selenodomain-associated transferase 1
MVTTANRCLILFVKEPVAGRVKTRLEPALGIDGALNFYQALLKRQISLVNKIPNVNAQLWVDGDCKHPVFNAFSGSVYSQQGADIGERMSFALEQALSAHGCAVLIGCDCPELTVEYLDKAFMLLEKNNDAVFGPVIDGGYILIGLRKHNSEIFQHIEWGSARVMEQSRTRLRENKLSWEELTLLHDIDEPADLVYLKASDLSLYE